MPHEEAQKPSSSFLLEGATPFLEEEEAEAPLAEETPAAPAPVTPSSSFLLEDSETFGGPTAGDKAIAAGQGVATGFLRGTPAVAGAVAGAKIGGLAGTAVAPGVGTFVGGLAGTIIGGAAGLIAGEGMIELLADRELPSIDEPIVFRRVQDLREDLRPFAFGGEVIGASAAPAGATVGLARQGVRVAIPQGTRVISRVGRFGGNLLNRILDFAAEKPLKFAAAEAGLATSSAIAEGVAETVAPGQTGVRVAAGVAAPIPSSMLLSGGPFVFKTLRQAVQRMGPKGRQTRAGQILQEYLELAGEDPAVLAQLLRQQNFPEGAEQTVAQKVGAPALAQFEAELRELDRPFQGATRIRSTEILEAIKNEIVLLRGTGDPQALVEAARMRNTYFTELMTTRADDALKETVAIARLISVDTPGGRAELSLKAEDILSKAISDSRTVERALWEDIPKTVSLRMTNLFTRFSSLRGEMLRRQRMPEVLEGTVNDWIAFDKKIAKAKKVGITTVEEFKTRTRAAKAGAEGAKASLKKLGFGVKEFGEALNSQTTGELIKFRKAALGLAREAAGKNELNDARVYGAMAEAALDDLSAGFEAGVQRGDLTPAVSQLYDDARSFSFRLNDVYSRTFAGTAEAVNNKGAQRIPPELMLERALAGGETLGALRLRELEEATRFLPTQAKEGVDIPEEFIESALENIDVMLNSQERLLRLSAAAAIDPQTGRVSTKQVASFIRENEELLDRFPNTRTLLKNALESEQGLQELEKATKAQLRAAEKGDDIEAFARVLRVESPAKAVESALVGRTPVKDYTNLVQLAKSDGPAAVQGLRQATWENAIFNATSKTDGTVSLQILAQQITEPLNPGLPSLLQMMRKEGIMSLSDVDTVRRLVNRAVEVGEVAGTQARGERILGGDILDLPEMGLDIAYRVIGSRVGVQFAGGQTGPSLIAAQRGSMAMRQVFDKVPRFKVQQILIDAMSGASLPGKNEPYSLAIALLEAPKTPQQWVRVSMQINAYIAAAGLNTVAEDDKFSLDFFDLEAE